jgi:sugar/nucleoside kinase (ribokinase family)
MHDKDELICFSFGDKIPVKHIEFSVGGNAANNTVGATRMGLKAGLVTTLGGDMIGNQIVEKLDKEGVDLTYAIRQPTANTNYSTVINFGGERTIFSYHAPRSYEFPVHLPVASWIYLTSMGETFRPFYNHFVSWIKKHPEIKLAFNPGSRQLRAGYDAMKDVLEVTHVIYVNRKEAKKITGKEDLDDKELLKALHALGPKICIITAGPEGSFVYDGERFVKAGILPVDSFERTGAGDAFGSGCISALVKGKSFEEALLWGTVNSASVIGYVGSQKGLLRESDIGVWLERAKSSKVEVGEF